MSDYPRLIWNLLSSPTAPEPSPPPPEAVEPAVVNYEHGLKYLTLQGGAYALGWQQGDACRAEIQAMVAGFYARFAQGWGAWLYQSLLPSRLYYLWQFVPPEYQAELWGVAQGAALPLRDILLINFFDDVLNLLELGWASACSCALVRDRRSLDGDQHEGRILLGRNLDYNSAVGQLVRPYQVLLRRHPNQGQASISLGVVGQVGVLTAMNEAGLSLGSLTSPSRERTWQGLGMSFIYRRMLDQASTVQAALECLQAQRPTQGNNLVLADPTHAVRVELTSRRHVCTWLEQEPLSITNHYLDSDLAQTQTVLAQKTVDRSSRLRQHRLCVLLPPVSEREDLIAAMTDTVWPDDTPLPTVEPWQTGGVVSNWGTLHTVVMTPSERRWDWALGVGDRPIQRQDFHTLYPLSGPVL